jgi:anti-anti-sigma factor
MSLHVDHEGDVAIVQPRGILKGDNETDELDRVVRQLLDNHEKILIDLNHVEHMTSIPIGVLVGLHVSAKNRHVPFCICNMTDHIEDVIVIWRLGELFTIFDSREEALEVLRKVAHKRRPATIAGTREAV